VANIIPHTKVAANMWLTFGLYLYTNAVSIICSKRMQTHQKDIRMTNMLPKLE